MSEMINIREKFDALDWWERPVNETNYHSDDLAKIVLATDWILMRVGSGSRMTPVQAWFGEYNPGKAANEGGNGLPKSKSSLVKTTRYGDREIQLYKVRNAGGYVVEEPVCSRVWLCNRYGHVMRKKKQEYVSHEARAYNLVGVATPNVKHFESEDPTEVVLMGEGRAPKELIRQIVYYLIARAMNADFTESKYGGRQCDLSPYRWEKVHEAWTPELYSQLTLRFASSYRVKDKDNAIRQSMAFLREQRKLALDDVSSQESSYNRAIINLKEKSSDVKKAQDKLISATSVMTNFLLSIGQGKVSQKPAAQAAPTQEKDNA